jgi:hypothetical protein
MGTHRPNRPREQRASRKQTGNGFGGLGLVSWLGNVHEKGYDFWEEEDESGDNCQHDDEKRQKNGELAGRYGDKRRLVAGNGRGKGRRLTFDRFKGDEASGGVRRDDLLWKPYKRNRSTQKRDRWRRGEGGNETGRDGTNISERKDPAGNSL